MNQRRKTLRVPWYTSHEKRIRALLFFIVISCRPDSPLLAATPLGLWYTEGGAAQVEINQCENTLCGRVVWLRSPLEETGCTLRDRHNPDPTLRHRPVLGLEILQGFTLDSRNANEWSGGTIYDPSTGSTYSCRLMLDGSYRLQVRGYVGIPLIGRTTTWIRVGAETQSCQQ
jgi:uncharacterized protein (DUF2147 family)